MSDDSCPVIRTLLTSTNPEKINEGLKLVEAEIAKHGSNEAMPLFEMVSTLFYIDLLDHPELAPILDKAITLMVGFGSWIIPILVQRLDAGDIKAQWAAAHVLGRLGADAINPLIAEYTSTTDLSLHAFILYALSKVKSPRISQAIALTIGAAQSSNLELRDTATRVLGKFFESIAPSDLSQEQKRQCLDCLRSNLADPNASVRAKAIRSLGKMAKYKHLIEPECKQLEEVCRHVLGTDKDGDWDRAFVVRKEASEALSYV
jgi:HEAT repeat protein